MAKNITTKYMFNVSQEGPRVPDFFRSLRTVPTNSKVFLSGLGYAGKEDLSKGYTNPKRKLWLTAHFSEIIKLQFGKNVIHCYMM